MMMSFHFVRMYKDAARLQVYKQTGTFPQVTNSTGLASLEEILREDASFPATKDELMHDQGWKLFDLTKGSRVRAADVLGKLPEKTYGNISDVVNALGAVLR
jgi:ubiquinone biosynthesis protein Coq4